MFIIWKGWGVIAILIPVVFMFIVQGVTNMIFGEDYYQNANWTLGLVLIVSAIAIYFIGMKLNNQTGQIVIDKETN